MRQPFVHVDDGVLVGLAPEEVELLSALPRILDSVGDEDGDPAQKRLDPDVHQDADAAADFRSIVGEDLNRERIVDRATFIGTLRDSEKLSFEDAEVWLRVIAEARLVIAARIGIDRDGWSHEDFEESHDALFVQYLGWVQESLIEALIPTIG